MPALPAQRWLAAHVVPPKKLKHAGRILAYDHKHRRVSDKGTPYELKDAHQLLADFFAEVERSRAARGEEAMTS